MSITYCHNCNKNIDEDVNLEHFENCLEESKEETHSLKPLRHDREILGLLERNIDNSAIIEEIIELIEVEKRQLLETAFKKIRISLQKNIRNEFYKEEVL